MHIEPLLAWGLVLSSEDTRTQRQGPRAQGAVCGRQLYKCGDGKASEQGSSGKGAAVRGGARVEKKLSAPMARGRC